MRTMKGQVKKNYKGWLIINFLSGLSIRIMICFIEQIEITTGDIKIRTEKEWTVIRRYNSEAIKQRFEEADRYYHEVFSFDDHYFGKGTENKNVQEAVKLDQEWLKVLGKRGELPKGKQIGIWIEPMSSRLNWLKDKNFNYLKQQLESLSNKFALNVKEEN